eukprot:PhF_6_TR30624/c0_g1_i4/m.45109
MAKSWYFRLHLGEYGQGYSLSVHHFDHIFSNCHNVDMMDFEATTPSGCEEDDMEPPPYVIEKEVCQTMVAIGSQLKTIHFDSDVATNGILQSVGEHCHHLEVISLPYPYATHYDDFSPLGKCKRVKVFAHHMGQLQHVKEHLLSVLTEWTQLEELNLCGCRNMNYFEEVVDALPRTLRKLNLGSVSNFKKVSFQQIGDRFGENLRVFHM